MSDSSQPRPGDSKSKAPGGSLSVRKFYVRSGKSRLTLLAVDAEVAALRFVQITLNGSMISGRKPVNQELRLLDVGAMKLLAAVKLDSKILISESGFTNSQAGVFDTQLMINRWCKQIAALENLIRKTG